VSECPQQPANQRRLARAKVAIEIDDEARAQYWRQFRAHGQGVRFVVQVRMQGVVAIIGGMAQVDHQNLPAGPAGGNQGAALVEKIRVWARELGFGAVGISDVHLPEAETGLQAWLAAGFHGEMDYMAKHGTTRCRPAELLPGTRRVIAARMDYWPADAANAEATLKDGARAYVSRYALGRDYHKVLRQRLKRLAERIEAEVPHRWRVFTDSAPVAEVALATASGLGWRGKHSLLLSREAGSYFFLGEIFTDLDLPPTAPVSDHCGQCTACLDACPTRAIVAPYRVDARRCISYLTIELHGPIPEDLRPLIGNRVYGCDDCQLSCPWNRFAQPTQAGDFAPRHGLDAPTLVELFAWTATDFAERMAGSPIYRIGFSRWLRNLAVGLGNAPASASVVAALERRRDDADPLVREHVHWALAQQRARKP